MGFFSKIRNGSLFFGKREPNMVVEFTFKGKKYILEAFDLTFKQDIDQQNRPNSETYGGEITITLSEVPSDQLNAWMMNVTEKRNGEFRFLMNDGKIVEGALLNIFFEEAYCIGYQKTINTMGHGVLTTLVIHPKLIKIADEVFENKWKN